MKPSLQTLLNQSIDYAGLFPPAGLPLDQSLKQYSLCQQSPCGWLVGRFVMPISQLTGLNSCSHLLPLHTRMEIAVVGRPSQSGGECLENLALDLERIALTRIQLEEQIAIRVVELPLPMVRGVNPLIREMSEQAFQSQLRPFFEIPAGPGFSEFLVQSIQACSARGHGGLKLRCGGATREAYPSIDTVARFITECAMGRVPMKFTAGLHHALPKQEPKLKVMQHGFINVLMGSLLAIEHRLAHPVLCNLLEETDPGEFKWGEEEVGWREYRVAKAEIGLARRFGELAFGCCHPEEPVRELEVLRWM